MKLIGFLYRRIAFSATLIVGVMAAGLLGFMLIEEYTLSEAFYMTIITISTVGYAEVRPLTPEGRLFTSLLILSNLLVFTYAITNVTSFLYEGGVKNYLIKIRMNTSISKLENHVVVCGFGRIGRQVCKELMMEKQAFVVIEKNPEVVRKLSQLEGYLYIEGEAIEDEILAQAQLSKANTLITTLPSDSDNVYVTLSAREVCPSLTIISRMSNDMSESKLKRAGCDYVMMPEKLGGTHMAAMVTKPDVLQFIRFLTAPGSTSLYFEELSIHENAIGKTLLDLDIRRKTGVNVIGFRLPNGEYLINPDPKTELQSEAKLIVLGSREQINRFKGEMYNEDK